MSKKEKELVKFISQTFKRHPAQLNDAYEADSEIINLGGINYAINIDSYSAEEDYFSDLVPANLGFNLAIATISDLLAVGADPQFYLHSMGLDRAKDEKYQQSFLQGIAEALQKTNTYLLGGDTSTGNCWAYTATAFGQCLTTPVLRKGARPGDFLYSTGKLGTGNRQALALLLLRDKKLPLDNRSIALASPRFISRYKESTVIKKYASFMIDSSDGAINSLYNLSEVNPLVEFELKFKEELIEQEAQEISKLAQMPLEIFLFSTLGEYELFFGIPQNKNSDFLANCKKENITIFPLGQINNGSGIRFTKNNLSFQLPSSMPDPRDLTMEKYVSGLLAFIKENIYG